MQSKQGFSNHMSISDIHSNYALCDRSFCQIALQNNRITASSYEVEQVITLVWHSFGLIGNNGFRFYFESSIDGDPCFSKTMACYKQIGALRSSSAFVGAVECFPDNRIPDDLSKRRHVVSSIPRGSFNHADSLYQESINEVVTCLAGFIRSHQSVPLPSSSMNDTAEMTHGEIPSESIRI